MSLEYSDDNELIYQAKAVAKDIVNAKYEVTKKTGDFLFLAHSEEEFYQRATAIDPIVESTSTRRLASVSDSKVKLIKALFQEWEIKHASCVPCTKTAKEVSTQDEKDKEQAIKDASEVQKNSKEDTKEASAEGSSEINFSLPERVAAPILPTEKTTQQVGPARKGKLWDTWSLLRKKKDGPGFAQKFLSDVKPEQRDIAKVQLTDRIVGNSLGRLDDPEVSKQLTPGSVVWVDPYGHYGPDKKRTFNAIRGRKQPGTPGMGEASELTAMIGRVAGRSSLGHEGVFMTHHKCTGSSFQGFNGNETGTFPQCQHEHHEGDGCGLTSAAGATEGSMQPGCGGSHLIVTAHTPHIVHQPANEETGEPEKVFPIPYLADEQPNGREKTDPSGLQNDINQAKTPEQAEALKYTNPAQEQTGEIPMNRAFLLHPEDAARFAGVADQYEGGNKKNPANLETFKMGGKTHRVGDIVSTRQGDATRHEGTENELGLLVGATVHRNGQNVRFGRTSGLGANTDNDSSRVDAQPGEHSLIIHKLNSPRPGNKPPNAVDPDTGQIAPVNETTMHYPSSNVTTVHRPKKVNTLSNLYSTLKAVQTSFKAKPAVVRSEQPKTVKPSRENLNNISLDLNDLFGDADE